MLADAKAQHLEVKQIFREWKPLGASVVASWRITAAPLLRLRKVPLRAYADVERIFAFERKIKPMLKTLKTEERAAKAQGCQGRGRARDGRLRSLRPAAGGARRAGHFPRAALPAHVRRVYLLFSCCMVLCAKERKMDPSPGPGP